MTKIKLLNNIVCPFGHRAYITAEELGLDYEMISVNLKDKEPFFTETYLKAIGHDPNSTGKAPTIIT